jgi:hypothetical protein
LAITNIIIREEGERISKKERKKERKKGRKKERRKTV